MAPPVPPDDRPAPADATEITLEISSEEPIAIRESSSEIVARGRDLRSIIDGAAARFDARPIYRASVEARRELEARSPYEPITPDDHAPGLLELEVPAPSAHTCGVPRWSELASVSDGESVDTWSVCQCGRVLHVYTFTPSKIRHEIEHAADSWTAGFAHGVARARKGP